MAGAASRTPFHSQRVHLNNNLNEPDPRPSNPMYGTMDMTLVSANEPCCNFERGSLFVDSPEILSELQGARATIALRHQRASATAGDTLVSDSRLNLTLHEVESRVHNTAAILHYSVQGILSGAYQGQRTPLFAVSPVRSSISMLVYRPYSADL